MNRQIQEEEVTAQRNWTLSQTKKRIQFLQSCGFVTESEPITLTRKGVLATEFNEAHPILSAELFLTNQWKLLSGEEIAAVLACFIMEGKHEDAPALASLPVSAEAKEVLNTLQNLQEKPFAVETTLKCFSEPQYWDLTTAWVTPVLRWLREEHPSAICADHGI